MDLLVAENLLKLLVAVVMGGCIGAEREYHSKSAGVRTTIMICVGATLFTMLSLELSTEGEHIAANIVNGIGFLGAGIIFREDNRVKGLTTAATIWSVAALGMCIGGGFYNTAVAGFIVILSSLLLLSRVSARIHQIHQTREYRIVTDFQNKTLNYYEGLFEEFGLTVQRGPQIRSGDQITGRWKVAGAEDAHEACIQRLLNDPTIKEFQF